MSGKNIAIMVAVVIGSLILYQIVVSPMLSKLQRQG
jgi:hypothetical protein